MQKWRAKQAREAERQRKQAERQAAQDARRSTARRSGWTPRSSQNPDVGVVAGTDHVVSFKTKGDHTLIRDGDYSEGDGTGAKEARETFDKHDGHNHYGPRQEAPGSHFSDDRGQYTGPDH